jgi:hypothetical protein
VHRRPGRRGPAPGGGGGACRVVKISPCMVHGCP